MKPIHKLLLCSLLCAAPVLSTTIATAVQAAPAETKTTLHPDAADYIKKRTELSKKTQEVLGKMKAGLAKVKPLVENLAEKLPRNAQVKSAQDALNKTMQDNETLYRKFDTAQASLRKFNSECKGKNCPSDCLHLSALRNADRRTWSEVGVIYLSSSLSSLIPQLGKLLPANVTIETLPADWKGPIGNLPPDWQGAIRPLKRASE